MRFVHLTAALFALWGAAGAAIPVQAADAQPSRLPQLRIDTGMHTAAINRFAADSACRTGATASDDKTIRVWSMPDGRLLRTQRLPIADGNFGRVYGVAVSPDGRRIAAAGADAAASAGGTHAIYIFDAATGLSVKRIGAFGDIVHRLAFSPDGTRIAASLGGGAGIRILDVESGRELASDTDFGGKDAYGLAFLPGGGLLAVAFDGAVRRYAPTGKRTARMPTTGGRLPLTVAADPRGQRIAVGFIDSTTVELFEDGPTDLRRVGVADATKGDTGSFSNVAWSNDGTRLFAGGRFGSPRPAIRTWTPQGRRIGLDLPVSENVITSLFACGNTVAFSSATPSFGLLGPEGAVVLGRGHTADMRGKLGDAFTVSADGLRVRFGLGVGDDTPVLLDLAKASLSDAPAKIADLRAPDITGLPVAKWQDDLAPRLDTAPIPLFFDERSRSLAVRPDHAGFVLGTDTRLRAYDGRGKPLWREREGPGVAWGVNFAGNGDLIVVAYSDGTVRWLRWRDGQELLAVFVDRQTRAWVAWTPKGYYSASPGGEALIGWHVNRALTEPADFFPAAQFRATYSRPDIVERVLVAMDEDGAVRTANAVFRKVAPLPTDVAQRQPPVLTILSPAAGTRVTGGAVEIAYDLRSPSGLPVDAIDVTFDAVEQRARGLGRAAQIVPGRGTITLQVPSRNVSVGLIARAGDLASVPAKVDLVFAGTPTPQRKPNLYALVIGVNEYATSGMDLQFAAKDAEDFAAGLETQKDGLYGVVKTRVLRNREVTRESIVTGLRWLRGEMTDLDLAVLFIAGHGAQDSQGDFFFLPSDASIDTMDIKGFAQDEMKRHLAGLPGKKLFFLDTCHSGQVAKQLVAMRGLPNVNKVIDDFAAAAPSVTFFSSSQGKEESQERVEWGHGAFTLAVLEGMFQGKAASKDGSVTPLGLHAFVVDRVKQLTEGQQHPTWKPADGVDFPIAVVAR